MKIPAPKCLGNFVDLTFSAESLILNNILGAKTGVAKEIRFSKAGINANGHSFDFVVSHTTGMHGIDRARRICYGVAWDPCVHRIKEFINLSIRWMDISEHMHTKKQARVKDSQYRGDPSLVDHTISQMLQINQRASKDQTTCTWGTEQGHTFWQIAPTAAFCSP